MYDITDIRGKYNVPNELWRMLESLDIITLNHSVRVSEICSVVEKEMGFHDNKLSFAGLFHDIGKFFISTKLLNKRGSLNDVERYMIDSHAYLSYKILMFYNIDPVICKLSLYHHKFDPATFTDLFDDCDNIITDDIWNRSTILKTIDIYEALTTDRPYHRGIDYLKAIETIEGLDNYDKRTVEIIKKHHEEFD